MRNTLINITVFIVLLFTFTTYAQERFSGVGIQILGKDQKIIIVSVIPNSPAAKAGIVPGLVIKKVDDKSIEGKQTEEIAHMIRGAVGSKVKLELFDPNNNKTYTVELTREMI